MRWGGEEGSTVRDARRLGRSGRMDCALEGNWGAVGNSGKEGEWVLDGIHGTENSGRVEWEVTYPREGERMLQAGGSGKEKLVRVVFTGVAVGRGDLCDGVVGWAEG